MRLCDGVCRFYGGRYGQKEKQTRVVEYTVPSGSTSQVRFSLSPFSLYRSLRSWFSHRPSGRSGTRHVPQGRCWRLTTRRIQNRAIASAMVRPRRVSLTRCTMGSQLRGSLRSHRALCTPVRSTISGSTPTCLTRLPTGELHLAPPVGSPVYHSITFPVGRRPCLICRCPWVIVPPPSSP